MNDRVPMLLRYRARLQVIVSRREDIALRRAWADAIITSLLVELAYALPEQECTIVTDIVELQNVLWLPSPLAQKEGYVEFIQGGEK